MNNAAQQPKVTKATLKSFINKNIENLFINVKSRFDGMTDMCERQDGGFTEVVKTEDNIDYTLGVTGAWFVGRSNDYFKPYEDHRFKGYEVYNSCGSFIVAIRK